MKPLESILIVGGGTAGWLTATILAAKLPRRSPITITVIEAPDIPIIGVGEGTWPSMRTTLQNAGIKETDFLKACDASFKQGSKFVGWKNGAQSDYYYHPFDLPYGFSDGNLAQYWLNHNLPTSFSKTVSFQEYLCEANLSPKLRASSDYAGIANYGYHLNAGKFSEFLKKHCTENLNVNFISDKVTSVLSQSHGDIASVQTAASGNIAADLFIDCTGFKSLLLGQHMGIGFVEKSDVLPINSALAVQVPYPPEQAIQSATLSTAQEAGWIWDIGLSNRRGVGYVYSNQHVSQDKAATQLQHYLGLGNAEFEALALRDIRINPGYRKKFWHKNCAAIGLSAGFLEPLEASAMVLIENSANMIADQLPANRAAMELVAQRFNQRCHYRWQRIIDFLKLHYVLSSRAEPFWRDVSSRATISDRLREDLALWQYQAPWKAEFDSLEEAFPPASYQYVLYGMGFKTHPSANSPQFKAFAQKAIDAVLRNADILSSKVESNRSMLDLLASR